VTRALLLAVLFAGLAAVDTGAKNALAQDFALPDPAVLAAMNKDERVELAGKIAMDTQGWPPTELREPMVMGDVMEELLPERSGQWKGISEVISATGTVLVYQRERNAGFVRLEDLETVHGPGLRVLLIETRYPVAFSAIGKTLDLGKLKSTRGNHNYHYAGTARGYRAAAVVSMTLQVIYAVASLQ